MTAPIRTSGMDREPSTGSEREALRRITERPLEDGPGKRWRALLAILALLAVAGIAYGLVQRARRADLEREHAAAAARGDSLARALAARDSLLTARPSVESLLAVLTSPNVASFPLAGSATARGSLVASSGGAILSADGLPSGEYALWHVDDAGPHRIAALGPAPEGFLFAVLEDAGFATGWGAIQVARESPGTSGPGEVVLEYRGFLR